MNYLLKLVETYHNLIFLSVCIPYITNNDELLWYFLYFEAIKYSGWIIFKGKCWLSLLEEKLSKKKIIDNSGNSLNYRIKKFVSIDIHPYYLKYLFLIINYLTLIVLTNKLNIVYISIPWIGIYELVARTY
tara:strand:+ start:99 stop:491 length:393 start_codon:yes stop_codon:yes gene_type:complete